jgi:hypothetical protein
LAQPSSITPPTAGDTVSGFSSFVRCSIDFYFLYFGLPIGPHFLQAEYFAALSPYDGPDTTRSCCRKPCAGCYRRKWYGCIGTENGAPLKFARA